MNDAIEIIDERLEQLNREVKLSYLDDKVKEYMHVRISELEHIRDLMERSGR